MIEQAILEGIVRFLVVAFALASAACDLGQQKAGTNDSRGAQSAATSPEPGFTQWPALPTSGFLAGRPASKDDVAAGNALFVAEAGGKTIGKPLDIAIPQYAWLTDSSTKQRVAVVVVQAEEANGVTMVGYHKVDGGQNGVALLSEFQLLGTTAPTSQD